MNETFEDYRKAVLGFLETVRNSVEKSFDLRGEFKTEHPSLRPAFQGFLPVGFTGQGHKRYTMSLDVFEKSELRENNE